MASLRIGELEGGGLVLGYRCPSRCRHCLYACGPHRTDGLAADEPSFEQVLDLLAARGPRARYHIGGGEPFLDLGLLRRSIAGLRRRRLALDYVETNAAWVRDGEHARATLADLAELGLRQVLVSLSPFHAEFVPLQKTEALIAAAEAVLPEGAFVWISAFASDLAEQPRDQKLDLDAFLAERGDGWARSAGRRYSLVPAGRAGRYFAAHGALVPWEEAAASAPCRHRLADATHFHVDLAGGYVPGLCAGLTLPLTEVPGEVDLGRYPVLRALVEGGPAALVPLARGAGFAPLASYSGPCDLCTHARSALFAQGHPELGPEGFYDPRSLPAFTH
ncbi:MAG: hypothetical protein QM765_09765 [Myxococcales bacterium]